MTELELEEARALCAHKAAKHAYGCAAELAHRAGVEMAKNRTEVTRRRYLHELDFMNRREREHVVALYAYRNAAHAAKQAEKQKEEQP